MSEIIVTCGFCGATLSLPEIRDFAEYKCPVCDTIFSFYPINKHPGRKLPSWDFGLSELEKTIKSLNIGTKIKNNPQDDPLEKMRRKNIKNKKAVK